MDGGTRLMPAPSRVTMLSPACWVAAPSQANTPAATPATDRTAEGHQRPAAEPRRARDGTHQEVVEPPGRLLGARRRHLAGGDEADQDGEHQEAHAEHGVGPGPDGAELGEDLDATEPEIVVPADLAMSP